MQVGDLVCYNAAGMKSKTLGLVLEISVLDKWRNTHSVLVQWCIVGKYMPRKAMWGAINAGSWNDLIEPGSVVWHEFGDWFEVVK